MISPPVTSWPAKTLTPRRLALESRPLREEPSPFLWAIRYLRDLDPRQLLAVARALLVAALGLVLEDAQLLALLLAEDLGLDLDLGEPLGVEDGVVGAKEDRLEVERGALLGVELLDEQVLALFDAVLLSAGLDDRVCHVSATRRGWSRPWREKSAGGHLCGPGASASMVAPRRPRSPAARRPPARPSPPCAPRR